MAEVTYYVAFTHIAVVRRAEALSRKEGHVGAVAFSRTGGWGDRR
jgi:hypothetical protein